VANKHYELKFLESTTNLRPLVKRAFGREPNAKVGRDIAVSIQQGRLFFEQAEDSPIEIRPLLVYYGVLSFARALIGAIKNVELSTLERGHGLKDVGAPTSIEKLATTVQEKGTFQEFNNAIAPLSRYFFFDRSMRDSTPNPFPTAEGLIGQELSITDVLSRIPNVHRTFTKTYGHEAKCLSLMLSAYNQVRTTLRIDDPFLVRDRDQLHQLISRLRTDYPFLKRWRIESVSLAWDNTIVEFDNARSDHDDMSPNILAQLQNGGFHAVASAYTQYAEPLTILPPMAGGYDRSAHSWAIKPVGDVVLNEYSLQFLGTFLLGSLVRYRPQIWQHAISRTAMASAPADDRSLSLIEEFIGDVLNAFPRFVVSMLGASSRH